MEVTPGAVIGGRYRAERRLGAGGVGEVWAGVRIDDGTRVAIKTLLPYAAAHHELVARFKREAEFLARIRSQYVAKVLDFSSDETYGLVLVMDLVEGEPLNEVLKRGPISVEQAIDICWDVIGGLAELHREHIVHRDLKPGNVMLQRLPNGKTRSVILDFGMSRFTGVDKDGEELTALTRADIAVGTMEYMAPEQILDSRGVTAAADIYAVGAMMYRAVAGRHVFGDLEKVELARHKLVNDSAPFSTGRTDPLARGFEALVARMIQRSVKERYARAEDVLSAIASLRSGVIPPELSSSPEAARASMSSFSSYGSSPEASPAPMLIGPAELQPPKRGAGGLLIGIGLVFAVTAAAGAALVLRPQWFGVAQPTASAGVEPNPPPAAPPVSAAPSVVLAPLASASATEVADTGAPVTVGAKSTSSPMPRPERAPPVKTATPAAEPAPPKPAETATPAPLPRSGL